MFALSALMIASFATPEVFGWHDSNQLVMTPSDRDWNCKNYSGIDVRNGVNFCNEVKKADNTWNGVSNSNFDLGYTTTTITDIHLSGDDPADDALLALAVQAKSGTTLVGADIGFDEDTFCFTDVSQSGSDVTCWDIQSIAAHEFGHMQWVKESYWNWDSIMQDSILANTERHNVEQHDIDVLQARH